MPLFYLKYTVHEGWTPHFMENFGSMTPEAEKRNLGEITLLGRWSTVGESSGFCVCEAKSANVLNAWFIYWSKMATIETYPVVDDNTARSIILGKEPLFKFDYSKVGDDAKPDESLYCIEYKFLPGKRKDGFAAFSGMSQEQDTKDAGKNTCYGRWHNLGTGSGFAICSSKSEEDLYTWVYHWSDMCDCIIRPVVSWGWRNERWRRHPFPLSKVKNAPA